MNKRIKLIQFFILIFTLSGYAQVQIKGVLNKWDKVILELTGPQVTESATTFTDYRMDVTFTH